MYKKEQLRSEKGKYITQGLFLEYNYNTDMALFTLDDEDKEYRGKTYPSLKKIYLTMEDPTEYKFATTVFGNYTHWKRLCEYYLKDIVEEWREELELKLRAEGVKSNIELAKGGNYNASKWLADRGWEIKEGVRTKKEKERRKKKDSDFNAAIAEDAERLGISPRVQ